MTLGTFSGQTQFPRNRAPNPAQIQKMLDENAQMIKTIAEYQSQGKFTECFHFQQTLHRNLMCIASYADTSQNMTQLLPPPQMPVQPTQSGDINQTNPPVSHPQPYPTQNYRPSAPATPTTVGGPGFRMPYGHSQPGYPPQNYPPQVQVRPKMEGNQFGGSTYSGPSGTSTSGSSYPMAQSGPKTYGAHMQQPGYPAYPHAAASSLHSEPVSGHAAHTYNPNTQLQFQAATGQTAPVPTISTPTPNQPSISPAPPHVMSQSLVNHQPAHSPAQPSLPPQTEQPTLQATQQSHVSQPTSNPSSTASSPVPPVTSPGPNYQPNQTMSLVRHPVPSPNQPQQTIPVPTQQQSPQMQHSPQNPTPQPSPSPAPQSTRPNSTGPQVSQPLRSNPSPASSGPTPPSTQNFTPPPSATPPVNQGPLPHANPGATPHPNPYQGYSNAYHHQYPGSQYPPTQGAYPPPGSQYPAQPYQAYGSYPPGGHSGYGTPLPNAQSPYQPHGTSPYPQGYPPPPTSSQYPQYRPPGQVPPHQYPSYDQGRYSAYPGQPGQAPPGSMQ